jgi:hypothetical protein
MAVCWRVGVGAEWVSYLERVVVLRVEVPSRPLTERAHAGEPPSHREAPVRFGDDAVTSKQVAGSWKTRVSTGLREMLAF